MSFDHLGLSPDLLRAVADQGYTTPTPVQAESIPLVLAGRDLLARAQTGTGKTAAFVLPILHRLAATPRVTQDRRDVTRRGPRVLVLAPTRELALQVEESVRIYGAHRPVRSVPIYGGVGFDPQVRALRASPEIVVATPGRLLDHVGQRTIDLSVVEVLVLDEADRMLDMGFIRDIRRILAVLPARRQNLLFSATFSPEIRQLADGLLDAPATVQVTPRVTSAELVRQVVIPVDRERKRELLVHLVRSGRVGQALVFARTKHGANRLAEQLGRDGIAAAAIHGNRSQSQRVRALDDFKAGRASILVATEVAARGLDIEALPHVINYELPMVPEDYVHRIGRTGRAGVDGEAISLVCVDEAMLMRDIERVLGHVIEKRPVEGFEPDPSIRPEAIRQRSQGGRPGQGQQGRSGGRSAPGARMPRPAPQGGPSFRPNVPAGRPHAPAGQPVRPAAHGGQPVRQHAQPGGQPTRQAPQGGTWAHGSAAGQPARPGRRSGRPGQPGQAFRPSRPQGGPGPGRSIGIGNGRPGGSGGAPRRGA
jgi:ATP-dependent RNA helicase RhlE